MYELGENQRRKIATIIITLGVTVSILYFHNQISAFMPLHKMRGFQVLEQGELMGTHTERTPSWYVLSGTLFSITGVSNFYSIFFPFSMLPFVFIIFSLIRTISSSNIFAGSVVAIYFISGQRGTSQLFFGLHGTGSLLAYSIILISVLLLLDSNNTKNYIVTGSILSVSLTYISYNWSLYILMFLIWLVFAMFCVNKFSRKVKSTPIFSTRSSKAILVIIVSTVITHTHFNGFLEFFAPYFFSIFEGSDTFWNPFERFFISWFSAGQSGDVSEIGHLYVQNPSMATYVGVAKYFIFICCIMYALYIICRGVNERAVVVFSFVMGTMTLFTIRLFVGSLGVTLLFFPGIICLGYIWKTADYDSRHVRIFLNVAVVGLILTSLIYFPIFVHHGHTSDDKKTFLHSGDVADWQDDYIEDRVITDVKTQGMVLFHNRDSSEKYGSANFDEGKVPRMSGDDALFILGVKTEHDDQYYILDYGQNTLTFVGWQTLIGWNKSSNRISGNKEINHIYSDGRNRVVN